MLKQLHCIAALAFIILFSGCAPSVHSDYDRTFDFTTLNHYTLTGSGSMRTGNPILDGPLVDQRLRRSLHSALRAKSFSSAETADFHVSYQLRSKTETDSDSDLGYGLGYIGGNVGVGLSSGGAAYSYETAVLSVSIYQGAGQKNLIWQGVAKKALKERSTGPDYMDSLINTLVGAVLKPFPPVTNKQIR